MPDKDIPQTGPEAILYALQNMTVEDIEERAKADLKTGKKTKRNGAVQLLNIAKGMRRNNLKPEDYMISAVPVIPPQYRPIAAQGDSIIPGDANVLYKDLIDIRDAYNEERELLGDKYSGQSRRALYDAIKSVYGYGEAVKPKTRSKDVQGFLKKITGRTAKTGWMASKMLAKPMDNVGRSTITVDPELSIDQISIPKDMAYKMYAPYIQRQLKHIGMTDAEALQNVRDRSPMADRALALVMEKRPVLYSRAPAWYGFNFLAGSPRIHDGDDIKINPYVTTGMNADFDGDDVIGCILVSYDKSTVLSKFGNNFLVKKHLTDEITRSIINAMNTNTTILQKDASTNIVCLADVADILHGDYSNSVDGKNGPIHYYHALPGTEVLSYDALSGTVEWKPVTYWSEHPDRKVEIITLRDGKQIFTDDDPRAVYGLPYNTTSLVPERFTPSDAYDKRVVVPVVRSIPEQPGNLTSIDIPYYIGDNSRIDLTFELGQFIGMMCGDGWVDKKDYRRGIGARYIHLADNDGYNAEFVKTYLSNTFGKEGLSTVVKEFRKTDHAERFGDTKRYTFSFNGVVELSKTITAWIGGERDENTAGSGNKHLPEFFLTANKDFREGLLCGLIATDGTCCVSCAKNNPQLMVSFTSTSFRLAREVSLLCRSLGIPATVTFSKITEADNSSWIVTLSTVYAKRNGCLSKMAHNTKRDTFVSTPVSESPEHVRGDHVPFPEYIRDMVWPYLYCPKRPANEYEQEACLLYQSAFQADQTITRFNASRLFDWLQATLALHNEIKRKAEDYLRSDEEACSKDTLDNVREALLLTVHKSVDKEQYDAAYKVYDCTKRITRVGKMGKKLKAKILSWLETHDPIVKRICDNQDMATWKRVYIDQTHITWVPIESVEKTGKVETGYDLTVPGYETFMNSDGVILSNTINVHVPSSDEAVKEAYEKLMPSKTPFSDRVEDKIVPLQKQEQILGLYTAATAPATKPVVFDTEEQAIRAIRRGEVPLSADVQIRSGVKMASADKNLSEVIPPAEKGPVRNPSTGKFMPTSRDNSVTEVPAVTEETTKKGE